MNFAKIKQKKKRDKQINIAVAICLTILNRVKVITIERLN